MTVPRKHLRVCEASRVPPVTSECSSFMRSTRVSMVAESGVSTRIAAGVSSVISISSGTTVVTASTFAA
ncbi:Uncharacterised protein [Mycobacterium tuberculosis]|nr:Uncharacterised protein [Mycobacterium tuberculosis]